MMSARKAISFKERLTGAFVGLAVCLVAMPIAVITTIVLMPFWSWLEATIDIEAVGHSGPAGWCYLFIYVIVVSLAGVIWSAIIRHRQQGN
jgi:hypothetical protein